MVRVQMKNNMISYITILCSFTLIRKIAQCCAVFNFQSFYRAILKYESAVEAKHGRALARGSCDKSLLKMSDNTPRIRASGLGPSAGALDPLVRYTRRCILL